ncbi:L domain-like protein [Gonapodya prolifera JEL478]|uniref:L domain-like protein n=1 Tax=Gonapodya prolifera (strain JEL478) TaxID=1344416 RepID=A0A139AQB8_GONPJ|nr:L domain-like protein [Gonapodya prolifera JEL478]|eukprot:KXS18939.1 L domain-like protein [Gonapodya prolifera JEL478]
MRSTRLLFLISAAILAGGCSAQETAPGDCTQVLAALKAGNVTITPASATSNCCDFFWESGSDRNADNYTQTFVTCAGGRVTEIRFQDYKIGSLSFFQNLTALTRLDVRNASIGGTIPSWISTLTKLNRIDFRDNGMGGTTEIAGQLSNLTDFVVSNNKFTGNLSWISSSTKLQYLVIANNAFTGAFPDITKLTALISLSIWGNGFTGSLPPLENAPGLTYYLADTNTFSGSIPGISKNPNLQTFSIYNNSLTGTLPDPSNCPKLVYYYAYKNSGITGSIPAGLFSLPNVLEIAVNECSLTGTVDGALSSQTQLQLLWLDDNTGLGGTLPDLSKLTKLKSLDISNTGLTGALLLAPTAGSAFCSVRNTKLCLSGGSVSSIPPSCQSAGGSVLSSCALTTSARTSSTTSTSSTSTVTSSSASAGSSNAQTGGDSGGSSIGPIVGGVVGGIAALLIIAGAAWFILGRKKKEQSATNYQTSNASLPPSDRLQGGAMQYAPNQYAPSQYTQSQYAQSPQMGPVGYMPAPSSFGSLNTGMTSPMISPMQNNNLGYGVTTPLLSPPGSVATVGTTGTSTSTNSTKVNEVYIVAQPYLGTQPDEMSCNPGQKIFVSDLFVDEWCKGLNLDTMQSGVIPMAILVSANQPSVVQSRLMSGSVNHLQARSQSFNAANSTVSADALVSFQMLANRGVINPQQYQMGSTILAGGTSTTFGDVRGPGM